MKTIGFRVSPKIVHYAIFDTDTSTVMTSEILKIPQSLELSEQLKYVRFAVLDIMREFEVEFAGIRESEYSAYAVSYDRIKIEGVIQEAFASSDLKGYRVGQTARIAKWLGIPRTDFKPLINGEKNWKEFENWGALKEEEREAVLMAIGVANDAA